MFSFDVRSKWIYVLNEQAPFLFGLFLVKSLLFSLVADFAFIYLIFNHVYHYGMIPFQCKLCTYLANPLWKHTFLHMLHYDEIFLCIADLLLFGKGNLASLDLSLLWRHIYVCEFFQKPSVIIS